MTPPFRPLPSPLPGEPGSVTRALAVAASQVGYREGSNNNNAYGAWYPLNFQPYCAIFQTWVARTAGVDAGVIPRHASTNAGLAWFRAHGQVVGSGQGVRPQPGDLFYVRSGLPPGQWPEVVHVGLVERAWTTSQGARLVNTLEGNTSDSGSSQGDGVYRLVRAQTDRLIFVRPAYKSTPTPPAEEEDDMTPAQNDALAEVLEFTRDSGGASGTLARIEKVAAMLDATVDTLKPLTVVGTADAPERYLLRDGGVQHVPYAAFVDLVKRGLVREEIVTQATLDLLMNPTLVQA